MQRMLAGIDPRTNHINMRLDSEFAEVQRIGKQLGAQLDCVLGEHLVERNKLLASGRRFTNAFRAYLRAQRYETILVAEHTLAPTQWLSIERTRRLRYALRNELRATATKLAWPTIF